MADEPPNVADLQKRLDDAVARNSVLQKQLDILQQRYMSVVQKLNRLLVKIQVLMDDANEMTAVQKKLDEELNRQLQEFQTKR